MQLTRTKVFYICVAAWSILLCAGIRVALHLRSGREGQPFQIQEALHHERPLEKLKRYTQNTTDGLLMILGGPAIIASVTSTAALIAPQPGKRIRHYEEDQPETD